MKNIVLILIVSWSALVSANENYPSMPEYPFSRSYIVEKVVANGVPRRGIEKIFEFQDKNLGASFVTDVYSCAGTPPGDVRACSERARIYGTTTVVVKEHDYAVYIDFKRPSRFKRFWLINLKTGDTEMVLVAHGAGSGKGPDPQRFSNRRNSRMTSLGFYVAGETYRSGNHGIVLRMHGLEKSNNNAFVRDVVFHGAKYATESYLDKLIKKFLGVEEQKIGESWGCPAVEDKFAQKVIPLMKNGGIFFLDHEDLLEQAMSGEEVWLPGAEPAKPPREDRPEKPARPSKRSKKIKR